MRRLMTAAMILVATVGHAQTDPRTLPLVQAADLSYAGAFTLPMDDGAGHSLTWGGHALGLSADGRSLYYACASGGFVKVAIPAVGGVATVQAPCSGPSNLGAVDPGSSNGAAFGGLLDTGAGLVVTGYSYYDGNENAVASHWSGAALANMAGPVKVGTLNPGWYGGAMGTIPAEWQSLLGGAYWTALHSISIINRSSFGETLTVFDPANLSAPVSTLLGYPGAHPLGTYDAANPLWNGATRASGLAFVPGTRSILSMRQHGDGYCYGMAGGTCPADPLKPGGQGEHANPYRHQVLAFDASDLAAVKAGTKQMWEVRPYASWIVRAIKDDGMARQVASTFDAATRAWYVVQATLDSTPVAERVPTVHVFRVGASAPPPPPPPVEVCGDGLDNDGDGQIDEGCAPPPPPPPAPVVQAVALVATCTVTATSHPPDSAAGWGVQFTLDGTNLGTRDTSAPFERQRSGVATGAHVVGGAWSRSGAVPVSMPLTSVVCQ